MSMSKMFRGWLICAALIAVPWSARAQDLSKAGIEGNICSHQGLAATLARLRLNCVDGSCDHQGLLQAITPETFSESDFLGVVKNPYMPHVVFFFRHGKDVSEPTRERYKIEQLKSILGPMIDNPDNTVAFVIGKASHTRGSATSDWGLSQRRVEYVHTLIEKHVKRRLCQNVYLGHVGRERFMITQQSSEWSSYGEASDLAAKPPKESTQNYLNQSVLVFVYPCFRELCQYMRTKEHLRCPNERDNGREIMPPECRQFTCDQGSKS